MLTRLALLLPLQIVQLLVGFGAIWAFTRLLSPADYGTYALVYAAAMLAHTLALTWAEAAAFRFHIAARATGRMADHLATLLMIAGVAAFIVAGIVWLAASNLGLRQGGLIGFAAGFIFFRFLTRIAREGERADGRVTRMSVFEGVYQLAGFGIGAALCAWTDLGASAPFAGLVAAGLLVALFDGPRLYAAAGAGRATTTRAKTYAAYGWPIAVALSFDLALQTGARALIAAHEGAADVGAYAAAFGLARTLDFIFLWCAAALSPVLLHAYETRGPDGARFAAQDGAAWLGALTIPAAVGLMLVAHPLTEIMVGPELRAQAAAILPWLALCAFASGWMTHYFSEAFQLARRSGARAMLMLAPAGAFAALCYPAVAFFGSEGVAMAAAVSAAIGACTLAIAGRAHVALPTAWREIAKCLLAAALMTACMQLLPDLGGWSELLLKGATGAAVYFSALFAFDVANIRKRFALRLASAAP